jgi:uncharacterized protein YjiS (DUF1127 family)
VNTLQLRSFSLSPSGRLRCGGGIDCALHKTQCYYAAMRLHQGSVDAYFPVATETNTFEASTTMNLIRNYRNWRRYRETVSELSRLSNRELNDLGINRGDIPFVARKSI